ncbi:MAG: ankyrin repeat domain-containing protein [Acidobacteria bacterium]|nr:ankyrin repeat domain-containing protein [Acidobacteriota bacterium]
MRIDMRRVIGAAALLLGSFGLAGAATDARLAEAVRRQDGEAVRKLLADGAPVNARGGDGFTALHWAAQRNDLEIADLLIAGGADANAADRYGVTPLALACTNASGGLVERLLRAGADANAAQMSGETALMTCARTGVAAAVEPLLAGGADVNAAESTHGQTALMWAAWEGHTGVVRTLLDHGAAVDARTTTGYTALLLAARDGHRQTTQALLSAGANVNVAAEDGTSALLVAVIRRHLEHAELLLDHGADPNLGPGFTPLHWAAGKWDTELNDLSNGVAEGNQWSAFGGLHAPERLRMVRLLIAHGADLNVQTERTPGFGIQVKGHLGNMKGATAFLIAAKANDVAVMRELLEHGADPLIPTDNGTTPLMVAAGVGHAPGITRSAEAEALRAVTLCVELGADVNAVNERGDTALHGAAWRERADSIVQFLADRGAELDVKNHRDWTPLVIAEGIHTGGNYIKSDTTAALLRQLGAAPSPPDILREPEAR